MLYEVRARVTERTADGWERNIGIPMFLLDGNVQGITGVDHAERIARKIINPAERAGLTVHVLVIPRGT